MKIKFLSSFIVLSFLFSQHIFAQNIILSKDSSFVCTDNIVIVSIQKLYFDSLSNKFSKTDYSNIEGFTFLNACHSDTNWIISFKKSFDLALEQLDKKSDYVIYVHGDGATFNETLERSLLIRDIYNVNVVSFFWPSKVPELNGLENFKNSRDNVKKYLSYFKSFLEMFQNYKNNNSAAFANIHSTLFLHSLGNYFIENLVRDSMHTNFNKNLFDNVVLNAAAVPQKKHKEWVEKLKFQKKIFITSNKKDFNLNGVRLFTKGEKQLGERVKKPLAKNAVYINFTKAIGLQIKESHSHTYFLGKAINESHNIWNFYNEILHDRFPDLYDNTMFHKRKDRLGFDIIK
jgi:hypothetical protein